MTKKKILLVNWGTETSIHVLREAVALEKYDIYLACTDKFTKEIEELFGGDKIIVTNPYDAVRLCEDVSDFMVRYEISFDAVTTFFEMCVYQCAFLANYLKVERKLSLESALRTSVNKYLMRVSIRGAHLNQPDFLKFNELNLEEAYKFCHKYGNSIIKPVHSGHSFGVRFVQKGRTFDEFKNLFFEAKKDYLKNYDEWMGYEKLEGLEFLVEEFVEGKIFSFDGIVSAKNKIEFIGSTEFELSEPPVMQQVGHTIPVYSLGSGTQQKALEYVKKVINVLELQYCGFHCEIKFREGEPILVEIAGRLPGAIITRAYQNLSKENIIDKFLTAMTGGDSSAVIKNKKVYKSETMRIMYSSLNRGRVVNSPGTKEEEKDNYWYQIRSRREGECFDEGDRPFGIWLYEVLLRSSTLTSEELVKARGNLLAAQQIKVIEDNQLDIKSLLDSYKQKIKNRLNLGKLIKG